MRSLRISGRSRLARSRAAARRAVLPSHRRIGRFVAGLCELIEEGDAFLKHRLHLRVRCGLGVPGRDRDDVVAIGQMIVRIYIPCHLGERSHRIGVSALRVVGPGAVNGRPAVVATAAAGGTAGGGFRKLRRSILVRRSTSLMVSSSFLTFDCVNYPNGPAFLDDLDLNRPDRRRRSTFALFYCAASRFTVFTVETGVFAIDIVDNHSGVCP